jgi:hypothetical protein
MRQVRAVNVTGLATPAGSSQFLRSWLPAAVGAVVYPVMVPEQRARFVILSLGRAGDRARLQQLHVELVEAQQLVHPQAAQVRQRRRDLRQVAGQAVDAMVAASDDQVAVVAHSPDLPDHLAGKVQLDLQRDRPARNLRVPADLRAL